MTTLPVLGAGITLLFFEREFAWSGFFGFDGGADAVAFQHLFWFFGHPEVYVIILPAFAAISAALENLCERSTPNFLGMALAMVAIAVVGFFVWSHHMFSVGLSSIARTYFSCATLAIGVPTAVKIFSWSNSVSEVVFKDWQFIAVLAFLTCFIFGGFTGLVLANAAIDFAFHDAYFVVGHFHFVLSIAAALGLLIFGLRNFSKVFAGHFFSDGR